MPTTSPLDELRHQLVTSETLPLGPSARLRAEEVSITRGAHHVLNNVSVSVSTRTRLAIVGENGRGKTTLLQLLSGALQPDSGRVLRTGAVGVVDQTLAAGDGATVGSLVAHATYASRLSLRALDAAAAGLAVAAAGAAGLYVAALDAATRLDAWDAERRVDLALGALDACVDRDRLLATLSVGQRCRVRLACVLGGTYDFLLLDEPTNHLDAKGIEFLSEAILEHAGGVVLVTHDRALLRDIASEFLDLDPTHDGHARLFAGGYDVWEEGRKRGRLRWAQDYEAQQEEHTRLAQAASEARNRLSTGWRPPKGTPGHQRQSHAPGVVQSVRRQQDLLEKHRLTVPRPPLALRFPDLPTRADAPILRCDSVSVEGRLDQPVSLSIDGGTKLVVTGGNGAGKSTLLAVLAQQLVPATGTVRRRTGAQVAYLEQEHPPWPADRTGREIFEQCVAALPSSADSGLLDASAMRTPVGRMSQGQQRRLHLALRLAERPHLLILDEPTNHLSAVLVDELTHALRSTSAAVIVATHDRQLLADLQGWETVTLSPHPQTQ